MDPTETDSVPQPDTAPTHRPSRRWPLGALTLIMVAVIAVGFWIFGGDDSPPSVTVPDLAGDLGVGIQNGEPAPDFSIELIDGTTFRLSDHLADDGRPVVLNLWASWCNPCREEMPEFDAASKTHTDVFFIGVAVEDNPTDAAAFAAEIGVSYPLAIDDAERVSRRYPSPGLPATFFISSEGGIVRTIFGGMDEETLTQAIAESFGL
jgi:thiol-disulfide isomerase/thioredoxin